MRKSIAWQVRSDDFLPTMATRAQVVAEQLERPHIFDIKRSIKDLHDLRNVLILAHETYRLEARITSATEKNQRP